MVGLTPLTTGFVARVDDLDVSRPIADSDAALLRQALLDHRVLVCSASTLSEDEIAAFASVFGEVMSVPRSLVHEDLSDRIHDHVVQMARDLALPGNPCNAWHADSTNQAEPEMVGVIRAVEVPPCGGDTLFADMVAAYQSLSEGMQAFLEPLVAVHDVAVMVRPTRPSGERLAELHRTFPPVEHPVIRTHPVTSEKAIFVNTTWTSHIVGLERRESDMLLDFLFHQAEIPERQYRHQWHQGDLLVWDNRTVQHYAVADYGQRRVVQRVSVRGDRPA